MRRDRPHVDNASMDAPGKVSDPIEQWLLGDGPKTLGSLVEVFEKKSFAVIFVILLGVPALPLPTGGATHVFEVIAMLLSLQLIIGRDEVWLPKRWRRKSLDGTTSKKFVNGLLKVIRWLERFSRPRLRYLFGHRLTNSVFGLVVLLLSIGAFLAPPFTGLDTLPSLGVVVVSLGVLLEDSAIVVAGIALGASGVVLEVVLGRAAFKGIEQLV
jgi:hypothetical protein